MQDYQNQIEFGNLQENIKHLKDCTLSKSHKSSKLGNYNSIKYSYVSTTTTHKTLGRIKIVFIKTKDNLIPIVSTNINLIRY